MTATAHALVGAAIASRFPDPIIAPILSLFSHFVLDSIPHWDFGTNWANRAKWLTGTLAIIETMIGLTLAYFLFAQKAPLPTLVLSIIASELPDWLEAPWFIFFVKGKTEHVTDKRGILPTTFHTIYKYTNLFHTRAQLPFGLITQVATVLFFLFLLSA